MHTQSVQTAPVRILNRRNVLALFAAGTGAALLAACGGGNATATGTKAISSSLATSVPTASVSGASSSVAGRPATAAPGNAASLVIDAVDYAFRTNGSAMAGMTMVQMRNMGQEDHQAQFLHLNDGVTFPQVQQAFRADSSAVTTLATLVGGPGTVATGGTSAAVLDLQAGQYVLVCLIPGRDGVSHAAKGMVLPLQVSPGTGAAASVPPTQGMVVMKEFSFALSASTFPAGRNMIAVTNAGAQPHEFGVLRLAPGKSAADVTQYFAAPVGPPPFASAGGLTALSPAQRGIAVLDLTPGNYAAICFVPDAASGKSHLQLGMIAGFAVA